jgi:hypothetical protein
MKKILLSAIFFIALSMNAQPVNMSIIGAAAGGWCDTCDLPMTSTDNTNYVRNNVTLTAGQMKFRETGVWNNNQMGTSAQPGFPSGTAVANGGQDIIATPGTYNVTLNRITGVYNFVSTVTFNTVNMSGTAVGSNPLSLVTTNGTNYFAMAVNLNAGNLVINQTTPSAITWSGTTFPSGTATTGTAGIPVAAGRYNINFNRTTGEYSFNPVIFTIIGNGVGGWADSNEIPLTTTNGVNYSLPSVTIVATGGNSEVKFRENNGWVVQIGSAAWPTGTGAGSGNDPNILAVPGTYSVALNRMTRQYSFTTLSNDNFVKYNFDFYPNPTNNVWNFKSVTNTLASITIVDALGKVVLTSTPNALEAIVDASSLTAGVYFAKVTSGDKTQSVKLVKN